jgi:hypothetical protein
MILRPPQTSPRKPLDLAPAPNAEPIRVVPLPKRRPRKRRFDPAQDDVGPLLPAPRRPYAVETLARLPLAEAFYDLWAFIANDSLLQPLFAQHRGRCYEDKLAFTDLVEVLAEALTRHHGSGRPAIVKAIERQDLPCQARAVYGKLARLPLPLAEAVLSSLTARLRPLFPAGLYRSELPTCLAHLAVIVLDGKKIKNAAKRLLATRGLPGKLFGGKLLAAYLPAEGLAVALAADADGEANDIPQVPRLLPLARAAVAGPRLWVADAQFCDLDQPALFTQEGDHFLLRFTLRNSFHPDATKPALTGTNRQGQAYRQDWGWMGSPSDARRRYVRRIVVERPGDEAVIVVTDLLDAQEYPAEDLLAVYGDRWQIETVFQQITEVFELRHLIGCTPQATVFQASLCLVIYNILQLIRGYIAAARPEPTKVEELSAEMIFRDLHEELISLHKTLKVEELLAVLRQPPSGEQLQARLRERLGGVWSSLWKKVVNKNPRSHKPKAKQSGAHTSVHKILQKAKEHKQKTTPKSG